MGTYGTPTAPTLTRGFLVQMESRVLLGTGGSSDLESSSWPASIYSAPIGLGSGLGLELGLLAALDFAHTPDIQPVAGVNVKNDRYFEIVGEETVVTIGLREFRFQAIAEAIASGKLYVLGAEALITFGGSCDLDEMPLVIEFSNVGCGAPASADIGAGVTGGILTLYKTIVTSGLTWPITAKEGNVMTLTFKAVPDTDKSAGNRLGNLYLY